MQFTPRYFDPAAHGNPLADGSVECSLADPAGKPTHYVYDLRVIFAINVALAARRPLLLAGEPGSGKTTLARNAARVLAWPYYEQTVSSRTQASDLLWELDSLRRLNDAYDPQRKLLSDGYYVEPGKLWWALNPGAAALRGMDAIDSAYELADPGEQSPGDDASAAVVLLDEIDKADPDVPNDLLEVLDRRSFRVQDKPIAATRERLLIILTTNGERELPGAFQRRCVTFRFPDPDAGWYTRIADRWCGVDGTALHAEVAGKLMHARALAKEAGVRPPGTAEYLDAVRACRELDIGPASADWDELVRCVFDKHATLDLEA